MSKVVRIEALTFFRFVAVVIVVIFHFGRDATGFGGVLAAGPQMVTFFFVLSGFVMALSYLHKDCFNAGSYWWARISRIMPVYLLALGLTLVLSLIYIRDREVRLTSLILNLTLLQSWFSPHPLSINPPGWALSVEAFFYFTFPFILSAIKKYNLSPTKMAAFSLLLWVVTQAILSGALSNGFYSGFPSFSHDLIYYFPLSHFCSFLLGISGGMWFIAGKYRVKNIYLSIALVGGAALLLIFFLNNESQLVKYLGFQVAFCSSFYGPLFLIFIISISMCQSKLTSLLSAKPLVLLGETSYSLYILQEPAWRIYVHYIANYFNLPPLLNFYAFFVFLVLISILSFLCFEKPANKFMRVSLPKLVKKKQQTI